MTTATAPAPTTPTPAPKPAAATDKTALGRTSLANNFNTFLSLLTTQLKNQDPLSPLDSNQFTQQLVQMSGVEAQLNTNDLLKQLVGNTATGVSTAVAMIGKNVKAVSDDANITGGKAQWVINVPAEATDAKVQVVDASGTVLHVESLGDLKAGDHAFTWNGKDQTGKQFADGGPYTLRVHAESAVRQHRPALQVKASVVDQEAVGVRLEGAGTGEGPRVRGGEACALVGHDEETVAADRQRGRRRRTLDQALLADEGLGHPLYAAGGVLALDRLGGDHGGEVHLVALVGGGVDVSDVVGDRRQGRGVGHQARDAGE
jgi:flagellar basal-body rod modification protein FlgD